MQQRLQTVQDVDVLSSESLFLLCTLLKILKQGISSSICLTLIIINSKMITREFLSLADLSRAQTLCFHKPAKVIIVG